MSIEFREIALRVEDSIKGKPEAVALALMERCRLAADALNRAADAIDRLNGELRGADDEIKLQAARAKAAEGRTVRAEYLTTLHREEMDRQLEANARARREALEEAARVADTFRCGCCGMDGQAAAAIRSLIDSEKAPAP